MIPPTQLLSTERYIVLERLLKTLKPGSTEHTEAWAELEEIKNNHGGMVPAETE